MLESRQKVSDNFQKSSDISLGYDNHQDIIIYNLL